MVGAWLLAITAFLACAAQYVSAMTPPAAVPEPGASQPAQLPERVA